MRINLESGLPVVISRRDLRPLTDMRRAVERDYAEVPNPMREASASRLAMKRLAQVPAWTLGYSKLSPGELFVAHELGAWTMWWRNATNRTQLRRSAAAPHAPKFRYEPFVGRHI